MTLTDMDPLDKIAMLASYGLMLVGIVVLGVVELLDGAPYGAAPLTNDAGNVIATPLVPPSVRTGLVIAALLLLAVYAVVKIVVTEPEPIEGVAAQPAD